MLKVSLLVLGAMLLFGLVFALLPTQVSTAKSGVTLQNVKLRLYPAQDPQAEWRFAARQITVDPEKGENTLDGLGRGERWLTRSGEVPQLDMTIKASKLVIDAQDNLKTQQAALYTLADCSTFTLSGTAQTPVTINQQGGYSAPRGTISSPIQQGAFRNITANFDFSAFNAEQDPGMEFHTAPPTHCVAGQIQPR